MANTKIGDIFSAKIDDNNVKFFQLVAFDLTQLNSDVIRAFKTKYATDYHPNLLNIVADEVDFYAHCSTSLGLNMKIWEKVGNLKEVGNTDNVLFRGTNDYGKKEGEEPSKVSNNWYVWNINDLDQTYVGELRGKNRKAFIGLIINPLGIIELLKGNKYPVYYPEFE
jgi:hypothetical protein